MSRLNELGRMAVMKDDDRLFALSRQMIEGDVDNRFGTWEYAVQKLLDVSVRRGEPEAGLAFVEQHAPGFSDVDTPATLKIISARRGAFEAWRLTVTREELLRRVDRVYADLATVTGFVLADNPLDHVAVLALRGETEAAVQVALADLFTQPVVRYIYSDWTDWWHLFDQPYLADVAADPRVSAEIERWTDEIAALREEARGYLADRAAGNIESL